MSNKKKQVEQEKLNLKKNVIDLYGDSIIDNTKFVLLDRPTDITTSEGETFKNVSRIFTDSEYLTYRTAIQQALLFNPERDTNVPSIEKRTGLAMKLTADTDVVLSNTEKGYITKCAKVYYSRPGQQSIIYLRILELVDPEEFNRQVK